MKLRVIGAGAMGMLLTAKLAISGAEAELVTRTSEQALLIREQGLRMNAYAAPGNFADESGRVAEADIHVYPAALSFDEAAAAASVANPAELPDVVLLMVKQTAITDDMLAVLSRQLKPSARLVCFQNGIGHMERLRRHIPAARLLTAVTTEGARRLSPRHVAHTGVGITWLGAEEAIHTTENDQALVKKIQNMLSHAGFSTSVSNDITSKVWNKLMINAVINPLTAVLQVPNGLLLELPAAKALMRSLYEEGRMLAERLGIELAPDLWEQLENVCRLTSGNHSSMLQDVQARRPTEAGAITGGLLHKARETGVPMPVHETMEQLIRSIEQQWEL
ncbi:ketopantoate reductase family protein [Paenibacillus piri]|nr:2-dehydropantoate 2-reductase [Paenibacillus piri]